MQHWIKPNIITQLWHKDKDTSPHFMVSSWSVSNGQKLWEFSDSLNGDPCQHVSHVVCVCNWQCHRKCSLSTSTCASICCSVWDEKCVYICKDTSLLWYVWFPVRMTSVLRYISVLNSWSSARSKYQTTFTLLHFHIFHFQTCNWSVCWVFCPPWLVKRKIKDQNTKYKNTFVILYFSFSDMQLVSMLRSLSSVTGQAQNQISKCKIQKYIRA